MDLATLQQVLKYLADTGVTKTVRQKPYPSISPTRPELNQSGRVVVITGGGTGVGFAIAKAFVRASADTVIILGRRTAVLESAASQLEQEAKATGTATKIVARSCDVTNTAAIQAFWDGLAADGTVVDVFINNAAKFTEPKPLLEVGADYVWSLMEANIKAPLYFTERFCKQETDKQRFIVNVTSAVIHTFDHPLVIQRPTYILSKMAGATYYQLLALETPQEKIRIVTMHPGLIFNDSWKSMGLPEEWFEDSDVPGGFALWSTSKDAAFLHGRFAWATWDVDELSTGDVRKRIDDDYYFLRCSVAGLKGSMLA